MRADCSRIAALFAHPIRRALLPFSFVLLWSTGFIGAKLGLPDAGPFTFLVVRFVIAAALLALVAVATGAPWPRRRRELIPLAVSGLLVHAVYLGGVFAAISVGVQAGVAALIAGLQPVLVAIIAGPFLGERLQPRQWLGLVCGLAGVLIVVSQKLALGLGTPLGMSLAVLALIGISAGTVYQKRYCAGMDLRSGAVVQFIAASIGLAPFAQALESWSMHATPSFLFALAWLVLVLSVGAVTLLFMLIRRGAAAEVSALFFLVPPATALLAWPLFGEHVESATAVGLAVATLGVGLVNLPRRG
jgi:drug/metabolite transporter (DMT)-like permease